MATRFYDRSELGKATILDNGFLKVPPSPLCRTGVQTYAPVGARPFTVMRTEQAVSASASSFELATLTDDHPASGAVTTDNAKDLSIGTIGAPFREGKYLKAPIMVTCDKAIEKIKSGKVQLSCGYYADLIEAPAGSKYTDPDTGEITPFDFYQTNIRGNHVALVHQGRAGDAQLHLDAGDCVEFPKEHLNMITQKLTIDGLPFEVTEVVAAAVSKERDTAAKMLAAVQADAAKLKTTLDVAEGQRDASASTIKTLTEKVAKLEDPKHIAEQIAARVAVEKLAAEHGITADGLDSIGVKRAVIAKLDPEIKLDGRSADYVDATFDGLLRKPVNVVTAAAANAVKNDPTAKPKATSAELKKAFNDSIFSRDASVVNGK